MQNEIYIHQNGDQQERMNQQSLMKQEFMDQYTIISSFASRLIIFGIIYFISLALRMYPQVMFNGSMIAVLLWNICFMLYLFLICIKQQNIVLSKGLIRRYSFIYFLDLIASIFAYITRVQAFIILFCFAYFCCIIGFTFMIAFLNNQYEREIFWQQLEQKNEQKGCCNCTAPNYYIQQKNIYCQKNDDGYYHYQYDNNQQNDNHHNHNHWWDFWNNSHNDGNHHNGDHHNHDNHYGGNDYDGGYDGGGDCGGDGGGDGGGGGGDGGD